MKYGRSRNPAATRWHIVTGERDYNPERAECRWQRFAKGPQSRWVSMACGIGWAAGAVEYLEEWEQPYKVCPQCVKAQQATKE